MSWFRLPVGANIVIDFVNSQEFPGSVFEDAHGCRICVRVFIDVSVRAL